MQISFKNAWLGASISVLILQFGTACRAQEDLGTAFGLPNSSPGVFWPRGMSIDQLSPNRLYPNGPNFGLSTTAGGFGLAGTGPLSGVGLTERRLAPLAAQEMADPFGFNSRLLDAFSRESSLSASLFGSVLAGQARRQMQMTYTLAQPLPTTGTNITDPLPSVDSILQDRSSSVDAILNR